MRRRISACSVNSDNSEPDIDVIGKMESRPTLAPVNEIDFISITDNQSTCHPQ